MTLWVPILYACCRISCDAINVMHFSFFFSIKEIPLSRNQDPSNVAILVKDANKLF